MKNLVISLEKKFENFTEHATVVLGHSLTFFFAILIVIGWITLDVIKNSGWHNIVNDLVFSFTFLMVFILQKTQNKFSTVMNIKLNELVASYDTASNRLIKAEDLSEEELRKLAAHYQTLSSSLDQNASHNEVSSIEHVIEESSDKEKD